MKVLKLLLQLPLLLTTIGIDFSPPYIYETNRTQTVNGYDIDVSNGYDITGIQYYLLYRNLRKLYNSSWNEEPKYVEYDKIYIKRDFIQDIYSFTFREIKTERFTILKIYKPLYTKMEQELKRLLFDWDRTQTKLNT